VAGVDEDRARDHARQHPPRLDPPRREGVKAGGDLAVAGGGGEQALFGSAQRPPGRVVVDQEGVPAQLAPVAAGIAGEAAGEPLLAVQRRGEALGQPLGGLEGPAAADTEERIGGERGVADQGEPRCRRRAHPVRHLDLADHRADAPRLADRRRVGDVGEVGEERCLRVAFELGQAAHRRHRAVEDQVAIGGEGRRPVGVHEPDRAVRGAGRGRPLEVGAVGEASVGQRLGGDVGELGDPGVAPVGTDDEPPAQFGLAALAIADDDASDRVVLAQQPLGGAAEGELDPRHRRGRLADQRVEHLAAQVHGATGALGGRRDPAPARAGVHPRAHRPRRHDRVEQVEPFERRHRRGLDEVGAAALEGGRVGSLLDQGDPRPGPSEPDRRRAAGQARADDHRVVVLPVGDDVASIDARHADLPQS